MKRACIEVCPECKEQVGSDDMGDYWCDDASHVFKTVKPLYVYVDFDPDDASVEQ